jgi:hypothetical protein
MAGVSHELLILDCNPEVKLLAVRSGYAHR